MANAAGEHLLERAVAQFILDFDATALTPSLRGAISRLMQDQLAVEIGCSQLPWSRQILDFARGQRLPGNSIVVASHERMSAADAAFVNATYGHGFEYDDAHRESASHPGCCVIPTSLAIGEEQGATLDDMLAALVVGYEVYARIGSIAAPELLAHGFHPHAVLSNFSAAAIAAKLRNFDAQQTYHALAIAASHASGITEYSSSGGSVKRVHAGIGVRNGIRSADLAKAGITGPLGYLTGRKGFYRTFLQMQVGDAHADRFAPGRPFEIEKVWIKPHCCCGCCHAYIDAVSRLADRIDDIASLDVRIQRSANVVVGTDNTHAYTPENIEQVQFSLPIQLAFRLLGLGNGYKVHLACLNNEIDLSPDGQVLRTARLIRITPDETLDAAWPGKFIADVTAQFRDGSSQRIFIEDPVGTAENPVSDADLDAKFDELTIGVMGAARSAQLRAAIKQLDGTQQAADFAALLAA